MSEFSKGFWVGAGVIAAVILAGVLTRMIKV